MNFKQKIQNLVFPLGSIQKIRTGYLNGYRIRLTENSLWSPLVGKWEPAMQKIMANVIRPGQIAYDLGANNGLHGLLMARIVGKTGMVINFEPFEENIHEINENFQLNGITNYRNVPAAVTDRNGTETFVIGDHHKQGFLENGSHTAMKKIQVDCLTLDKFIEEGNPGPNFIKMDIEGAEGAALNGFANTIQRYLPLMIIELHNPEQDLVVGRFLKAHGYSAWRFDTFSRLSFTPIRDFDKCHPAPEGIWGSIFCLPAGKKPEDFTFDQ